MIRKFPAIQRNRQNDILFDETIPLNNVLEQKTLFFSAFTSSSWIIPAGNLSAC
jgi:hypothetical protein